jgi:hypothetical protein
MKGSYSGWREITADTNNSSAWKEDSRNGKHVSK